MSDEKKKTSIYNSFDPKRTPITLLLKGPSGSRKTTKAVQFPRPALFNFDNNLSGLRNLDPKVVAKVRIVNPQVGISGDIKDVDIWANFVKQLELVMDDPEIDTIIIDSITTMAERLMDKIVGSSAPDAKIQIQHWGDFSKYLKWLGDELLCNPKLDKHVIIIAHEQVEKDKATENILLTLNIGGRMKTSFGLYFSDVWRCYAKTAISGGTQYRVRVAPTSQFDAKCSLSGLPEDFLWDDEAVKILNQLSR